MANYFLDNPDIAFHFNRCDLGEVVSLAEDGYAQAGEYPFAPVPASVVAVAFASNR